MIHTFQILNVRPMIKPVSLPPYRFFFLLICFLLLNFPLHLFGLVIFFLFTQFSISQRTLKPQRISRTIAEVIDFFFNKNSFIQNDLLFCKLFFILLFSSNYKRQYSKFSVIIVATIVVRCAPPESTPSSSAYLPPMENLTQITSYEYIPSEDGYKYR